MSTTLIVAEKPSAAQKIAYALGKTEVKREGKVHYFHTKVNGEELIVVPAVGHLFGLAPKVRGKYPIFDLEWKPIWEVSKKAAFSKPYAKLIEKLAKSADKFIIACDFDIEGEVIGLNVLRYLCHQKDAKRMKFSTLTAPDLREAYDNVLPSIAWGQAEAGEARHYLDWIWGVNLSQAAMAALMEQGIRKTLSIGRVQGPALALLAKRELDIRKFVPKPYWQISILLDTKPRIEAWHHTEVFWSEGEAKKIFEKIKDKPTKLVEVTTVEETLLPPTPFDLTTLQMEAWRNFKLTPKMTQQIAQDLYTAALISYPRTSSQKLPPTINYKAILMSLSREPRYRKLTEDLLKLENLIPNEGKK
ncbi:MAG: DNA topoisomerase, partial [Candidatus Nanoarchaeia archaeon]